MPDEVKGKQDRIFKNTTKEICWSEYSPSAINKATNTEWARHIYDPTCQYYFMKLLL